MKRMNLYISAFSMLLSMSVLTGCDKEESLFGRDVTAGMYELDVTLAGFTPAEGQSSEGAEVINIPFGNDDAMGLVMIDGDKITHTRYIYKELLGKWSGDLTVKNPSAKIYAYYPYDENLETSSLNTEGENAAEFFSRMVADFVPQEDQSEEEDFRKSNLMVGVASLDEAGKKISINMEPVMALAVVTVDLSELGTMSLESDPTYTWNIATIESLAPFYKLKEKTFVSYIMPGKEQETVSIPSGSVVIPTIEKSTYKECSLSLTNKHKLQVGDFFMKDGSLLGKDATLTAEQKANCIGIVFQTDGSRIGEAEKDALNGNAHGLVLALKNVDNSNTLQFSVGRVDIPGIENTVTLQECYDDINGLAHTKAVYAEDPNETKYPIFNAVKYFSVERPEDKTTEWFLPSVGQFWDMLVNLGGAPTKDVTEGYTDNGNGYHIFKITGNTVFDKINNILGKTNSDKFGLGKDTYDVFWVSSVKDWQYARRIVFNNTDLQLNIADKQGSTLKGRPILAF